MKNIFILAALLLASCGDNKSNNKGENNNNNDPVVWTIGQDPELARSWTEGEVTDQHYVFRPDRDWHKAYGYLIFELSTELQEWLHFYPAINLPSPNYFYGWEEDYDPRDWLTTWWEMGWIQYAELTFESDPDEGIITGYTFVVYWTVQIMKIYTFKDHEPNSSYTSYAWAIHHGNPPKQN